MVDDTNIDLGRNIQSGTVITQLIGKKLGAWLVEENIYITVIFTEWGSNNGGGSVAFMRSTLP